MRKYILDSDTGEWKSEASFDVSAFRDVELDRAINELLEEKLYPLFIITVGGSIYNTAIYEGGMIYFGCCDKKFYAISQEGKFAWSFDTQGVIVSSPCMAGDRIFFGSYDYNLYCLDKRTGKLLWKFPTGDKVFSSPCTDGKRVFFGSRDGNFYCVSVEGRLSWKIATGGLIESHPMIYNSVVYFGSNDQNLYAVGPETGEILWRFRAKSGIRHGLTAMDGVVYFVAMEKTVYGVTESGKQVFSFQMKDFSSSSPLAENGMIYIPSRDSNLYAVRADGKLAWSFRTGFVSEGPALYNGMLFFGSDDRNLYAADASTGKLMWKFPSSGYWFSIPVIRNGMVYIGGWDCNFYAIGASDGKLMWKFPTSIAVQSLLDVDSARPQKHFEVVWLPDVVEKPEEKKEGKELSEYAVGENVYGSAIGSDYVSRKKRGYV